MLTLDPTGYELIFCIIIIIIIIIIINASRHCKARRDWKHSISPKIPTPQSKPIEIRQWKTKMERAAHPNK